MIPIVTMPGRPGGPFSSWFNHPQGVASLRKQRQVKGEKTPPNANMGQRPPRGPCAGAGRASASIFHSPAVAQQVFRRGAILIRGLSGSKNIPAAPKTAAMKTRNAYRAAKYHAQYARVTHDYRQHTLLMKYNHLRQNHLQEQFNFA